MPKPAPKPKHHLVALSLDDVAARTGLGRVTLYRLIRQGRLTARKAGRRTVILEEDLAAYLTQLPKIEPKAPGHGG